MTSHLKCHCLDVPNNNNPVQFDTNLRPGVDFTNILQRAFTHADLKKCKKDTDDLTVILALLGSAYVKASDKTLVK